MRHFTVAPIVAFCVTLVFGSVAFCQYPRVPKDVGRAAKAKTEAMLKRSEEAWRKALPTIKQWESKG